MCEQRFGATGSARLVRLLTDLGERGFLSGVAGSTPAGEAPTSWWRKLVRPREKIFTGLGPRIEALYRHGGWVFFTRPALIVLAVLGVLGLASFIYLIAGRYGTPFVVASKFGLGGLVFLLGRFAVVAVHETAHGLTMASFGRRVDRAGLKTIAIFPYAFVDTSEAWFEPRRRRIAVSAAGPLSDFSLGAIFALCALLLPEGTVRDIFFNLAFAAYVGAFFNLNPFIERDGYHMLVDGLNEPGLRRRAKEQLERRLRGEGQPRGRFPGAGALLAVRARLVGRDGRCSRSPSRSATRRSSSRISTCPRPWCTASWARCGWCSSCLWCSYWASRSGSGCEGLSRRWPPRPPKRTSPPG